MQKILYFALILVLSVIVSDSARILTVVPAASISHQVVFRPLTQELVNRGHKVTVITTDPAFPKGQTPKNLTEIDLHDLSYGMWRDLIMKSGIATGDSDDTIKQIKKYLPVTVKIFEKQFLSEEVQTMLRSKPKFDLLILEAGVRAALIYSHIFKDIPVILFSSLGAATYNFNVMGAPANPPLLYPTPLRQRLFNLTKWEKITELYNHYIIESLFESELTKIDKMLKRIWGGETPSISELGNNVDLLMLNLHPIWDQNRPVPPSVVYIGGIHQKPSKELPKDLKKYLDSSRNGVIYISYGTNVSPSMLPPEKIQMLVNVFSKLSYDVLWKWDHDELPGRSKNIKISKWLPQSDLLKHPKIKLFITQGGLQSTDEAIEAGVPLIGMPMLGDQWYNVEQYIRNKIGIRLDMNTMTEDKFLKGLKTLLNDDSYRKNMVKLRSLMRDQSQTSLERAVWWTEHLLRHGSGKHLRAPAAIMSWTVYLDVELMIVTALGGLAVLGTIGAILYMVLGFIRKNLNGKKIKQN